MIPYNFFITFLFLIPITRVHPGVNKSSNHHYELMYWRDGNDLILHCRSAESFSAVFRINETEPIYFAAAKSPNVSAFKVLEASAVLPTIPLGIAKFKLRPQYEGTYFCGNPNIDIWSEGVGPLAAKPIIRKENYELRNQRIGTTNGQNVTMVCPVLLGKLVQFYDIQWLGVVNKSNKFINNSGHYSTLTIFNVQDEDYKDYRCKVTVKNPIEGRTWDLDAYFTLQNISHGYSNKLGYIFLSWLFGAAFLCLVIPCFTCCDMIRSWKKKRSLKTTCIKSGSKECIDGLRLIKDHCIGTGAFGTVFKGTYQGRICAAKMLTHHAQFFASGIDAQPNVQELALKSFHKECKFLKELSHKNVVEHITTIPEPTSNLPILVMELMDCSLKSYLEKRQPQRLPILLQISLFLDISQGLKFLHSKDLIHRDICDDNVLLDVKSDIPRAKISDFGMSRLIPHDCMSSTLSALGHRQIYLPPEAAEYPIKYTDTLDVYALGVLGLQIAVVDTRVRNCNDLLVKLSENHLLRNIIIACLRENGHDRPNSSQVVNMITSLQ